MFSFIFSKEESFNFLFMLKDSGTGQTLLIFTNSFNCNERFLKCSSTLVPIQLSARKIFFFQLCYLSEFILLLFFIYFFGHSFSKCFLCTTWI